MTARWLGCCHACECRIGRGDGCACGCHLAADVLPDLLTECELLVAWVEVGGRGAGCGFDATRVKELTMLARRLMP